MIGPEPARKDWSTDDEEEFIRFFKTAREYERKILNLLQYGKPHTRAMALKLLDEARRDAKISILQLRRLEKIIGPAGGKGSGGA
jgi:hypothetical protein